MHPLLRANPYPRISSEDCPDAEARAAGERERRTHERLALYDAILNAPTLAEGARIMQIDPATHKPRWTGYEGDPAFCEGWQVAAPWRVREMSIGVYLTALAYGRALPRLRCPERKARAIRAIRACADAVRRRAWVHLDQEVVDRDAAEIEALLAGA